MNPTLTISAPEESATLTPRSAQGAQTPALSQSALLDLPMALLQPVADVPAYLATRAPVPHFKHEPALWMRVPKELAREVRAQLDAFDLVNAYRRTLRSVSAACRKAINLYSTWNWKLVTFRAKYDLWLASGDWLVLLNRAKAGALWQEREAALPEVFVTFVASRFGQFGRSDGKRQAVFSIHRQWRMGRNPKGELEIIPGYEAGWNKRNPEMLPAGWSYDNLCRVVKQQGKFTTGVRALLHEGESAARSVLPNILSTRKGLRFLELVTFDDVRTDWLVFDPASGQACELWLLVARDTASAMILGFVMHPATVREDGTATHLGARHMKQLAGWMLERYPLPPYVVTWKLERGTAGMDEGVRAALGELLGQRIAFSITSMIGAQASPAGYAEKKKGNSRGKASHESHNRLLHTQGAFIAGQTGARYEIRPADLLARSAEAGQVWEMRGLLPAHLRGQEQYPLLTLGQAREHLFRICAEQNARTDHALEGFEEIIEKIGDRHRQRMEMPVERAARLVQGIEWTPVSPSIVQTFYEHTERAVTVKPNGELEISVDGRALIFAHGGNPLPPGTKALAYFHPDDPKYLHLTDGRGGIIGTWSRRGRVAFGDHAGLAEAMRYTHIAREAAREHANQLATPQRAELEAMRAHNAELLRLAEFTDVTPSPRTEDGGQKTELVGTPLGAALSEVSAAVKSDRKQTQTREQNLRRVAMDAGELATADEDGESKMEDGAGGFSAEGLL